MNKPRVYQARTPANDAPTAAGSPSLPDDDGAPLGATQSIVSVLNNPAEYNYLKHLGIAKDAWMLVPPLLNAGVLPDVRMEDFEAFIDAIGREHRRYESARDSEHAHKTAALLSPGTHGCAFERGLCI